MKKLLKLFSLLVLVAMLFTSFSSCEAKAVEEENDEPDEQSNEIEIVENTTPFNNPLANQDIGDPFMTYDSESGYYYALFTLGNRIEIYRSRHAGEIISDGDSKVIYRANEQDSIYGSIWAPEMHRGSDGKWYIYTIGQTDPNNGEKHLFVIQAQSEDPFGEWKFMNILMPEIFAIDPTIYTTFLGNQYLCYSRVDPEYGQVLEICEMESPYICSPERVTIARAELEWELVEPYTGKQAILEGAFFVKRNGRLFIIYSANGCWSNSYALGVLEHIPGSILDADNWVKHEEPLLTYGNEVYGPGHASFFESPDGTELWCAYHGMVSSNDNEVPMSRFFNLQRVEFDVFGFPVMGQPIGYDKDILPPSGEEE